MEVQNILEQRHNQEANPCNDQDNSAGGDRQGSEENFQGRSRIVDLIEADRSVVGTRSNQGNQKIEKVAEES